MLNLVEASFAEHAYKLINITADVEVKVYIRLSLICRFRLPVLLSEALLCHLPSRKKQAMISATPDSKGCDAPRLEYTIGFPNHSVGVIDKLKNQVAHVASEPLVWER